MWTYTVVVLYLFITAWLGWRGYRGTRTALDYLVAGRGVHPYIMAMSYGATFISTSAIIGFGGAAAVFGMGLLWLVFANIFVGIFLAFILFGDRTRRMGYNLEAHTFPELMGNRFDSRFIQGFSGVVIFLFMPLYTSVVIIGAAKFIATSFGLDYQVALFGFSTLIAVYVIMGGLKGVMYTDAFQGSIMLVGMLFLLFFTYRMLGGVTASHRALADLAPLAREVFPGTGQQGWASFPLFGSRFWWVMVSTLIMGVGIGVLAQPQLAVRFMTVRSRRELNRAILIGGIFILVVVGVVYVVGALTNVYFFRQAGRASIQAAAGDVDEIIPLFISQALPGWFGVLFLLTLISAAMSTISSQFHAVGTSIGRDFFEKSLRRGRGAGSIAVTRLGILAGIVFSVFLGYWLERRFGGTGTAIIARGTAIFFGICAAAFLPMYAGGLLTRRITRSGAIAGMLSGLGSALFWLLFMHLKESSALLLCRELFGRDSLVEGVRTGFIVWDQVDPICVALPLSLLVTVGVSLATSPPPAAHLARCFAGVGRKRSPGRRPGPEPS
ncbi:MAG TPA: sodium:solute symporter family protein [bacterium]|nr:sodium:solute symporter family protein [bacterium]